MEVDGIGRLSTKPVTKPKHILIIPDGTRRFAQKKKIPLAQAYKISAAKIGSAIKWVLGDFDVQQLTIYALSYDNVVKRKKTGTSPILNSILNEAKKAKHRDFIKKQKVKIRILGETQLFSKKARLAKKTIEFMTSPNKNKKLNILAGYSGRREIVSASAFSNPNSFQSHLWLQDSIDLIVRTAGNFRLSDCPLYQSSYAELFFLEKLFPEIARADIECVLKDWRARKRRFGE